MKKKHILQAVLFLVIIYAIIHVEVVANKETMPESIFIRIVNPITHEPEINAKCKANIKTDLEEVNNIKLVKIDSMFEWISKFGNGIIHEDKGFYRLNLPTMRWKKEYNIDIICINNNNEITKTTINNENNICEIRNDGVLIC